VFRNACGKEFKTRARRERRPPFQPVHAKELVCALGALVFAVDMVAPADVNVGVFYCFVIVLCAWTRSSVFLWGAAAVFTCALRVASEILTYQGFAAWAWSWLPVSAITEMTAVTIFAINLLFTFARRPAAQEVASRN
jgi:hypothetical protein